MSWEELTGIGGLRSIKFQRYLFSNDVQPKKVSRTLRCIGSGLLPHRPWSKEKGSPEVRLLVSRVGVTPMNSTSITHLELNAVFFWGGERDGAECDIPTEPQHFRRIQRSFLIASVMLKTVLLRPSVSQPA